MIEMTFYKNEKVVFGCVVWGIHDGTKLAYDNGIKYDDYSIEEIR